MGQCSTLPAEARQNATSSPAGNHGGVHYHRDQQRDDFATGRRHNGYVAQKNQNTTAAMTESFENESTPLTDGGKHGGKRSSNNSNNPASSLHVKVPQKVSSPGAPSRSRPPVVHFADSPHPPSGQMPPTHPGGHRYAQAGAHGNYASLAQDPVPMEEDRPPASPIPAPPESAKKTRCYKLNLDSNFVGLSGGGDARTVEGQLLGPFSQAPPALTSTVSDDSSTVADPTAVAVRTAQIFRGITISSDGTILSQNARATRANRNKNKRGEKSRQAAKIDKAKDLVEESVITGKAPNSDDPANMVSLFIFGEYDSMSHLVRDGSKKLRDASELPDEDLLAVNMKRPAEGTGKAVKSPIYGKLLTPTRKRVSPHSATNPSKSRFASNSNLPQTAPPKLKGHPRDRPSARRLNNDGNGGGSGGFRRFPVHDACNGMFSPQHSGGNDSDWSEALGFSKGLNSFFYCGGADQTVAPTPKDGAKGGGSMTTSPVAGEQATPVNDYRNESNFARGTTGARTEPNAQRVEAPGTTVQV